MVGNEPLTHGLNEQRCGDQSTQQPANEQNNAIIDIRLCPQCYTWKVTLSIRRTGVGFAGRLLANMMSSTKLQVRNVLHCRQRRTEQVV